MDPGHSFTVGRYGPAMTPVCTEL